MAPTNTPQLSAAELQLEAERVRGELEAIQQGKAYLKKEIQQAEAKEQGYGSAFPSRQQQRGQQPHHPMPGSFVFSVSSAADTDQAASDAASETSQVTVNANNHRATSRTPLPTAAPQPPPGLDGRHDALERIRAAMASSQYVVALEASVQLTALLHEDLALHVAYLESVVARQATDLTQAQMVMEEGGLAVPQGMLGGYYSETTASADDEGDDGEDDLESEAGAETA